MAKRVISVVAALVAGVALAGCGGTKTISQDEFADQVVSARDRTDYALAQITKQQTKEAFLDQMLASADLVDDAASDFENAGTAEGFKDEAGKLTDQLFQLGADLRGTAEQIQTPGLRGPAQCEGDQLRELERDQQDPRQPERAGHQGRATRAALTVASRG